jgi:hypothetical protein
VIDATKLYKALKNLTRVDGCSNSWDVNGAVADTISAIDEYITDRLSEHERKAREASAAPEKIPTAREETINKG